MAQEPKSLTGKVVAITGGARGIGKATAEACAAQGMKVAIGDLDEAGAKSAAEEIGGGAVGTALNVTERESFERFIDFVDEQLGPVDVLVNNAGIMHLGRFVDEDDSSTQRMIDINVNGVLYGMKVVLPRFLARDDGHLVNIASSAGKGGYRGRRDLLRDQALRGRRERGRARGDCRDTAIEVSCVMPGIVNTELAAGLPAARGVKNIAARGRRRRHRGSPAERPASTCTCPSRSGRSTR